jgi:hypothetical protein
MALSAVSPLSNLGTRLPFAPDPTLASARVGISFPSHILGTTEYFGKRSWYQIESELFAIIDFG